MKYSEQRKVIFRLFPKELGRQSFKIIGRNVIFPNMYTLDFCCEPVCDYPGNYFNGAKQGGIKQDWNKNPRR